MRNFPTVLALASVAVLGAVGCSNAGESTTTTAAVVTTTSTAPTDTKNAVGGNSALAGDVPADAICHTMPEGCTPRPTVEQAQQLEYRIGSIYPGLPDGKAADWAISTCSDIVKGQDDPQIIIGITRRFAGGTRPDPTMDQAVDILGAIRFVGFCV